MGKLIANVWVDGAWFGPSYPDAGAPPAGRVSNPACWEGGEVPAGQVAPRSSVSRQVLGVDDGLESGRGGDGPPPRSGPGSGRAAWRDYAAARDVTVADDAERADIIAACDAAGVPTE